MDENPNDNGGSSSKKAEANRRNAQLSTGPRTEDGKSWSRRNAVKHGILASALLITKGEGAEDAAEFDDLLGGLLEGLAPVGMLEEIMVENIAMCYWRHRRALRCEAGLIQNSYVDVQLDPTRKRTKDFLCVPLGYGSDHLLRYETTIQRQLSYAINQLERLQRARKGEHVPAPVSVQVSSDQ